MPVSGLAVVLSPDPERARAARRALEARPEAEVVGASDGKLAVVTDTPDRRADRALWDWMHDLDGVVHVDVVFIHFDEDDPDTTGSAPDGRAAAVREKEPVR